MKKEEWINKVIKLFWIFIIGSIFSGDIMQSKERSSPSRLNVSLSIIRVSFSESDRLSLSEKEKSPNAINL